MPDNTEHQVSAAEQARQKAERLRSESKKKEQRKRVITASVVALAGIGLLGGVFYATKGSDKPLAQISENGSPDNVTNGYIAFGDKDAPVRADLYFDYMCPACKNFEEKYNDTIDDLVENGEVSVRYHPIAVLNRMSRGSEFSTRAAGASFCVASNGLDEWRGFHDGMFANQPDELTTGLRNKQIVSIADSAGVVPSIEGCVDGNQFEEYANDHTDKAISSGITGTPTLKLNGMEFRGNTVDDLLAAVKDAEDAEASEGLVETGE